MYLTLFSVACFSFSTLARVSSRSSISFFSSEHSSSSFLFLAVSSAFISSSSSSRSVSSLAFASIWILFLIRPSHLSSASQRLSCSCLHWKDSKYSCKKRIHITVYSNILLIKFYKHTACTWSWRSFFSWRRVTIFSSSSFLRASDFA